MEYYYEECRARYANELSQWLTLKSEEKLSDVQLAQIAKCEELLREWISFSYEDIEGSPEYLEESVAEIVGELNARRHLRMPIERQMELFEELRKDVLRLLDEKYRKRDAELAKNAPSEWKQISAQLTELLLRGIFCMHCVATCVVALGTSMLATNLIMQDGRAHPAAVYVVVFQTVFVGLLYFFFVGYAIHKVVTYFTG